MKALPCEVNRRAARHRLRWLDAEAIARHCFAFSLLPALLFTGCAGFTSTTLPPAASYTPTESFHGPPPLTVGVVQSRDPAASDSLVDTLQATGLFAQVDYVDALSSAPDLLARVEQSGSQSMACPVPTLLTLGFVPTRTTEMHGHVFSLESPGNAARKILIDHRYEATTTIGWVALLKALSPNETLLYPERHARYRAHLRQSLLDHSPQIDELMRSQASAALK